jgi:hypothetical protein
MVPSIKFDGADVCATLTLWPTPNAVLLVPKVTGTLPELEMVRVSFDNESGDSPFADRTSQYAIESAGVLLLDAAIAK